MCIKPLKLNTGEEVACRECWQCVETRVDDWVGRCIAESKTAVACNTIDLTYGGGDHERAAWLTYSDVQKYFKILRRRGYPCRYFAVGEYGGQKGRSHWHLIVFWLDKVPPHELRKRFDEYHWAEFTRNGLRVRSRGFSYWDVPGKGLIPSTSAIRYVCKYIYKDQTDLEVQGHLSMSKKPPLGDAYFYRLAGQYVDAGLSPQDFYYSFPESRRKGKPVRYCMQGKTAENFCAYFVEQWAQKHNDAPPRSEIIWDFLEKFRYDPERRKYIRVDYHSPWNWNGWIKQKPARERNSLPGDVGYMRRKEWGS